MAKLEPRPPLFYKFDVLTTQPPCLQCGFLIDITGSGCHSFLKALCRKGKSVLNYVCSWVTVTQKKKKRLCAVYYNRLIKDKHVYMYMAVDFLKTFI